MTKKGEKTLSVLYLFKVMQELTKAIEITVPDICKYNFVKHLPNYEK